MNEYNKDSSNFPLNVVRYSKLNDSEYPIVKFGADERLMKKLLFSEQLDLNSKLTDLMNDDYYKKVMPSGQEEREFKGESEFVDFGNEIYNRTGSLKVEKNNDLIEGVEKKVNSEHILEETSKFVPIKDEDKSGGFGQSSGLKEVYQLLQNIDEIQKKRDFEFN